MDSLKVYEHSLAPFDPNSTKAACLEKIRVLQGQLKQALERENEYQLAMDRVLAILYAHGLYEQYVRETQAAPHDTPQ